MNRLKNFIYENIIPAIGSVFVSKNKYCNVIYYHDIVKGEGDSFMRTNIEIFKCQMQYIAQQGYETLRFDDFKDEDNLRFKKKRVLIAFDDGWLSNYTEIYDFMESLDLKYNIYLTIGEISNNPNYLTWEMVRRMHDSGLCGFGVHTYTHPDMSDLNKIDLELEVTKADTKFIQELGFKPLDFCYPFGYYSEASNEYLSSRTEYKRIYTSAMLYSYLQNHAVIFGRNGISNSESFKVFKGKLKGYYNIWKTII